jgi:hypothetical protein
MDLFLSRTHFESLTSDRLFERRVLLFGPPRLVQELLLKTGHNCLISNLCLLFIQHLAVLSKLQIYEQIINRFRFRPIFIYVRINSSHLDLLTLSYDVKQ